MPDVKPQRRAKPPSAKAGLRRYASPTNLLTSLVLVFPLFLFYQLAVLALPDVGNGVDVITPRLAALLHHSASLYLGVTATLAAAFLALVLVLRRRQRFELRQFGPVVVESAFYAIVMAIGLVYLMGALGFHAPANAAPAAGPTLPPSFLARLAIAVGAGVHEELVFRLVLFTGLAASCEHLLGMKRWSSIALALVVSSLAFSAAHHVIGHEPWALEPFAFRFFCGVVFAVLYQWRGFAVAVYTHALYDVYVMLLR